MKAVSVLMVMLLTLISCSSDQQTSAISESSLRLNWIVTGSHAGEIMGHFTFAKKHKLQLDILPGGQGLDPLKLVGKDQFGIASADEILRAIDKGADLKIIGVLNYFSPACFISKREANITSPADLPGKVIGILPFGSTGLVFNALVREQGIDKSKLREKTVSPDLRIFLTTDEYDIHPAFIYDETVSLDMQGVKYNVLEPRNWGITFIGPCYFCTSETLSQNPELVKSFIYTMCEGWSAAIAEPKQAIAQIKRFSPQIDSIRELQVLNKGIDYYRAYKNQPLNCDEEAWEAMLDELLVAGVISVKIPISTFLDLSHVNDYYSQFDKVDR